LAKIQTDRSLGPGQAPIIRAKYAHMLPKDYGTWSMFLSNKVLELDEVWYDVHVGRPMLAPIGSPQYILDIAAGVSRKRIDVVGRSGEEFFVIEVKPHANMEALGQAITYRKLFREEFKDQEKAKALIVSRTADADIIEEASKQGILILPMEGVLL
jgi:hypothetical protein